MIKLMKLQLKMWVRVAVSTELHKKNQYYYTGIVFLGVYIISIIIDELQEIY